MTDKWWRVSGAFGLGWFVLFASSPQCNSAVLTPPVPAPGIIPPGVPPSGDGPA
jgi:hypothetical protein